MGQTMFRGRDPKPLLLPLSRVRHNGTTVVSVLARFWKLCISITGRFRFAAPKPPPADSNPAYHPYSNNNNINDEPDHEIENEEPILAPTDEIGIERPVVEEERTPPPPASLGPYSREQKIQLVGEEELPPLPPPPSPPPPQSPPPTKIKKRASLGPYSREQEILLVGEEEPPPLPPPSPPAPSTKSKSKKRTTLGPYNREQKILLIGDGDFSFSACLAVAFGDASNMIATSLDSFDFLIKNYAKAATNITKLTRRNCKVIHGVNAIKMARHPELRSLKFDRIVYNFPHAGFANLKASREDQIRKHQALVKGFLKNAKKMIKEEDGQIHITHKCVGFFLQWNLEMLGSSQGLRLVEESPFKLKHYPGYATKYGFGGDGNFDWRPSKTYKFQLSN